MILNNKKPTKKSINKSIKKQVWEKYIGKKYKGKCYVSWCETILEPWDFEVGHNVPESKGGKLNIKNLRPICRLCNGCMGNHLTIDQFSRIMNPRKPSIINNFKGWFTYQKYEFGLKRCKCKRKSNKK